MSSAPPILEPEQVVAACCTPSTGEPLDAAAAAGVAQVFRALGDPTRVRLLAMIAAADGGEACICDMTDPVGLSQPTVSHHMGVLTRAGLVTREQRGRWAYYALAPRARQALDGAVAQVTASAASAL